MARMSSAQMKPCSIRRLKQKRRKLSLCMAIRHRSVRNQALIVQAMRIRQKPQPEQKPNNNE